MFSSVLHFFNSLIFLDLILTILCCILLIKLPVRYAIKFISIPLVLFTTYILLVQGEDLLGRPYNSKPIGEFEFIDYRIDNSDGVKKIEIWVLQNKKSKLFIIDYTPKKEEQLAQAKSKRKAGAREQGEFKQGKPGKDGKDDDLSIGDIPANEILIPKDSE